MGILDEQGDGTPSNSRKSPSKTLRLKRMPQGQLGASLSFNKDGLTKELVGETIKINGGVSAYTHISGADSIFFVKCRLPGNTGRYKPTAVYVSMINATAEDSRDLRALIAYSQENNSNLGIEGVVEEYDPKRRLDIKYILNAHTLKCQSLTYKVK